MIPLLRENILYQELKPRMEPTEGVRFQRDWRFVVIK